jgi:hypothetical protein
MANGKYERGLKVVLAAGAGLTLSISGDAMADLAAATPQSALAVFKQAVLDGKVQLSMAEHGVAPGDEKMQNFSNVFKNSFDNGSPS